MVRTQPVTGLKSLRPRSLFHPAFIAVSVSASWPTGQLRTVGSLGLGTLEDASFDISDVRNTPLAALRVNGQTRLYVLDLGTGRTSLLGTVSDGRALWGMAIEP